jgi:hypothetical protein
VDCLKNSRNRSETGHHLQKRSSFANDEAFRTNRLGKPTASYPNGRKFFQKDKKQQYKNI